NFAMTQFTQLLFCFLFEDRHGQDVDNLAKQALALTDFQHALSTGISNLEKKIHTEGTLKRRALSPPLRFGLFCGSKTTCLERENRLTDLGETARIESPYLASLWSFPGRFCSALFTTLVNFLTVKLHSTF
ncbi:hypothetical protein L915_19982, partial [Phytophthora nicotianae]